MSHHSKLVYNPTQGRKNVNQLTGSDEKSYDHPTYDHDRLTNHYLPSFLCFPSIPALAFAIFLRKMTFNLEVKCGHVENVNPKRVVVGDLQVFSKNRGDGLNHLVGFLGSLEKVNSQIQTGLEDVIPWKSKAKQRIVFGMIHMKDSLLPRGKV